MMSDMARISAALVSSSRPSSFPTWMSCEPTTMFMPEGAINEQRQGQEAAR